MPSLQTWPNEKVLLEYKDQTCVHWLLMQKMTPHVHSVNISGLSHRRVIRCIFSVIRCTFLFSSKTYDKLSLEVLDNEPLGQRSEKLSRVLLI